MAKFIPEARRDVFLYPVPQADGGKEGGTVSMFVKVSIWKKGKLT